MFEPLILPVLNRLLRANSWALDALRAHAGKTACLECPPAVLRVTVLENGELARAPANAAADIEISVTPGVLLRAAARDEAAWSAAQISGDVYFAAAIDHVRRNLEWDYEEDLSRLFGDIAAHRLSAGARALDRRGREAAKNLSGAFAEYAVHEQPLIASMQAVEEFNREVDVLRDDVERAEKRIALLRQQLVESAVSH